MKTAETLELLLGDEAVARAAVDAGIGGAYAYPGTPATEIMEALIELSRSDGGFHARWSANEKVAFEEALGMSHVGRRALVAMKHVGLNVAADPLMSSALTGAGGLVIAVADDPGMHSSQNEQDSRYYADFAKLPCFEPSDQQECYDMTRAAFDISEQWGLPAMLRLVTRIAHGRAAVLPSKPVERKAAGQTLDEDFGKDPERIRHWTLIPTNARRQFRGLIEKQAAIQAYSHTSAFNKRSDGDKGKTGILACGLGHSYVREALSLSGLDLPWFKVGFYPPPVVAIRGFLAGLDSVLVIEDGYPFLEERLLGWVGRGPNVHGRRDGTLPQTGEMNTEKVLDALFKLTGKPGAKRPDPVYQPKQVPTRLPTLCPGCPHTDTFKALNEALSERNPSNVYSDIGCYTLGVFEPHNAINSCVDMGASIGMAKGASEGGLAFPVAVIGDSTFGHSGMTALRGAAYENTPMTVLILDNGTVAMTGGQESLATGDALLAMVKGLGVDPAHVRTMLPLPKSHAENVKIIAEELDHKGLSVIVSQRECIITAKKK